MIEEKPTSSKFRKWLWLLVALVVFSVSAGLGVLITTRLHQKLLVVENKQALFTPQTSDKGLEAYLNYAGFKDRVEQVVLTYEPNELNEAAYVNQSSEGVTNIMLDLKVEAKQVHLWLHYNPEFFEKMLNSPDLIEADVLAGICLALNPGTMPTCTDQAFEYIDQARADGIEPVIQPAQKQSWLRWLIPQAYAAGSCSGTVPCGGDKTECTCSAGSDWDHECRSSLNSCSSGKGKCSCRTVCDESLGQPLRCSSLKDQNSCTTQGTLSNCSKQCSQPRDGSIQYCTWSTGGGGGGGDDGGGGGDDGGGGQVGEDRCVVRGTVKKNNGELVTGASNIVHIGSDNVNENFSTNNSGVFSMNKKYNNVFGNTITVEVNNPYGSYQTFEVENMPSGCTKTNSNTTISCPKSVCWTQNPDSVSALFNFKEKAAPSPNAPPECTSFTSASGKNSITKGESETYTVSTSGDTTKGQLYWRCSGSSSWTQVSADRTGNQPYSFTLNTNNVNCNTGTQNIQIVANIFRGNGCSDASCRTTGNPSPAQPFTISANCRKEVTVSPPPINTCGGTIPSNAIAYDAEENQPTVPNGTKWTYSAKDTNTKCQYKCVTGYDWINNKCTKVATFACVGNPPDNSSIYDGDDVLPPSNLDWIYASPGTTRKCEFYCNSGYTYNWSSNTCETIYQPPVYYACTGNRPGNSIIWSGSDQNLTSNVQWSHSSSNTGKCKYYCNTGYTYNSTKKTCDPVNYKCTGTPPDNSSTWSGSDQNLTSNVQWSHSSSNTGKCKYYCNTGYTYNATNKTCDAACSAPFCGLNGCPNNDAGNPLNSAIGAVSVTPQASGGQSKTLVSGTNEIIMPLSSTSASNRKITISWDTPTSDSKTDGYELYVWDPSNGATTLSSAITKATNIPALGWGLDNCDMANKKICRYKITRNPNSISHEQKGHVVVSNPSGTLMLGIRAVNNTCSVNGFASTPVYTLKFMAEIKGNFYESNLGACTGATQVNPTTSSFKATSKYGALPSANGTLARSGSSFTFTVPYIPELTWGETTIEAILQNSQNSTDSYSCSSCNKSDNKCVKTNLISPQNNVNIYLDKYNLSNGPWWQVANGLIYAGGTIKSSVPNTCGTGTESSCKKAIITKQLSGTVNSDSAGIPISGSSTAIDSGSGKKAERTNDSGITKANFSSTNSANKEDYLYFSSKIDLSDSKTKGLSGTVNLADQLASTQFYDTTDKTKILYSNGNLTIKPPSSGVVIPANQKVIVFVKGDLIIQDTGSTTNRKLFSVPTNSYLAFIVYGNIAFDKEIGHTINESNYKSYTLEPNVSGVFVAKQIAINSDKNSSTTDKKFVGEGTFVAWDAPGFSFNRDFNDSVINKRFHNGSPTELFIYRPSYLDLTPEFMKTPGIIWQEVN